MAYNADGLSALSYANGFTLWNYKTTDNFWTVETPGYFKSAANMLRVGDFIFANMSTADVMKSGMLVVVANSEGTVEVMPNGSLCGVSKREAA